MEYRRLGKSGLQVSVLSLGSWLTIGKVTDDKTNDALMSHAYDAGINFFDSAEIYANGQAELAMGKVLKKKKWDRTSYLVSSKVFFGVHGEKSKPNQRGLSRKHIMEACDAALTRMNVDYLDLYFCHRPDKNVPMEEIVWAMNHLLQQGKILYWGTSEWSAQEIMHAHAVAKDYRLIGPTMEQPQYNMFERDKLECEYLQIFKTVGLGTTIWSPLLAGVLTGKYNKGIPKNSRMAIQGLEWLRDKSVTQARIDKVKQLTTVAEKMGITTTQMALAWCLKNENVSTVILGATKLQQLKENLTCLDALPLLNAEIMQQIEKVLNNKPVQPAF